MPPAVDVVSFAFSPSPNVSCTECDSIVPSAEALALIDVGVAVDQVEFADAGKVVLRGEE